MKVYLYNQYAISQALLGLSMVHVCQHFLRFFYMWLLLREEEEEAEIHYGTGDTANQTSWFESNIYLLSYLPGQRYVLYLLHRLLHVS